MTKVITKALVLGFIIGTVFLGIAPLGLGIAFVEFLRPILIPGIDLFRSLYLSGTGAWPWVLGLILNGLIYTALFLSILVIQKHAVHRKVKFLTIVFVSLVFLAITGMLTNFYFLIANNLATGASSIFPLSHASAVSCIFDIRHFFLNCNFTIDYRDAIATDKHFISLNLDLNMAITTQCRTLMRCIG